MLGFLRTPQPDLRHGDTAVNPLQWLAAGGEVSAVVAAAQKVDWYTA